MADGGAVLIVGGTHGLGLEIARTYADRGRDVVITGRDAERAQGVARDVGERVTGLGFDLAEPDSIAPALAGIGPLQHLVLAAIERDENTLKEYDRARGSRLVMLKLVGYTEVAHALADRMDDDSSILIFGGRAKDRPYVGSLTVTTVNAGVSGLVRAFAIELAPIRVSALHPGIVGDSPYWAAKPESVLEGVRARTPTGRLTTMADIVGAATFLLENRAINGVELYVDGGWMLT